MTGGLRLRLLGGALYGGLVLICLVVVPRAWVPLLVLFGIVALLETARLVARAFAGPARIAALLAGAAYLFGGLGALALAQAAANAWALLAVLVTWAADIAAYAIGSRIGRRPIAPRISPRKTVEGTIGGIVAAALAALGLGALLELPMVAVVIIAGLAGPAAFIGDLVESALKRAAGVKDSGGLVPGHGGVLDRIDSLLLVGPVVVLGAFVAGSGMMER